MEPDFNLDVSWLNDFSLNDKQMVYEKESMADIHISFIYINVNNEIHKIISETHDLEVDEDDDEDQATLEPFLSKDYVLSVVSNNIKLEKSHYRLFDILLFNVDLEPSDISSLSSLSSNNFTKKISILDDIVIPKSIPIFHSTNALYFIFKEIPVVKKPSLVISGSEEKLDEIVHYDNLHSKTRKQRSLVKYTRKKRPMV
jgi:hypothetical protein